MNPFREIPPPPPPEITLPALDKLFAPTPKKHARSVSCGSTSRMQPQQSNCINPLLHQPGIKKLHSPSMGGAAMPTSADVANAAVVATTTTSDGVPLVPSLLFPGRTYYAGVYFVPSRMYALERQLTTLHVHTTSANPVDQLGYAAGGVAMKGLPEPSSAHRKSFR